MQYTQCLGAGLFTSDGHVILDCLSGYCVHNLGDNHPAIIDAMKDELARAGELAGRLCRLAGGDLHKVFFCSSGSEGVEAAIKFARMYTKRTGLVYTDGAFHGLTCGALSLMGGDFWNEGFGPMLPDTHAVPFGDVAALHEKLKSKQIAAFVVEPMQGEGGKPIPSQAYWQEVRQLCSRYGTLLVFDEMQTGFYRTGRFLAGRHYDVHADMVVLAKALSGGLIPSGAVLMTEPIYQSVHGSLKRSQRQAIQSGKYLRARLRELLCGYEMVDEVRGQGMFNGLAFKSPRKLTLRACFEAFTRTHPAMFGHLLVMRLFRDHGVLTQICGNNSMILKVAPPLIATREQLNRCAEAMREVVALAHKPTEFWTEALHLGMRAANG